MGVGSGRGVLPVVIGNIGVGVGRDELFCSVGVVISEGTLLYMG